MKTVSLLIQSLCVPCYNHCRYCLLSWDGKTEGTDWERSVRTAERFLSELKELRPDLHCSFSFGYSMEHPDLREAIRTLRRLGSPTESYLQCDGMKMRSEEECSKLMTMLKAEGIEQLNFTLYGLRDDHDRFAGRKGDYDLIIRMMRAAQDKGIPFSTGIPLTMENISQADELVDIIRDVGCAQIRLFIPHEEGRGKMLGRVRLTGEAFLKLAPETRRLMNAAFYRTESDWLKKPSQMKEDQRHLLISLRHDNIEDYEKRSALSVIQEIEELDEAYYTAFPGFAELAAMYGDPNSGKLYQRRDLYYHYRMLYAEDHDLHVYDVTDERLSGSRRS